MTAWLLQMREKPVFDCFFDREKPACDNIYFLLSLCNSPNELGYSMRLLFFLIFLSVLQFIVLVRSHCLLDANDCYVSIFQDVFL